MQDTENDRLPDDFEVEVISLAGEEDNLAGGRHSSLPVKVLSALATRWRNPTRRGSLMYAAIALSLALLLAIVTRSSLVLPVGNTSEQQVSIPPLPPGYSSFYMQADVPWMQVLVDGHHIEPPRPGIDAPLTLKPGHHLIVWHAAPFLPQSCRLSIPYAVGDSCNFAREEEITAPGSSTPLQILLLHESLFTLPAAQQTALLHAIQASLDSIPASQTVQAGEQYVVNNSSVTATQPLQATLRLSLDTDSDTNCALDVAAMFPQPCMLAEQDCARLCTIPWQVQQALEQEQPRPGWLAFVKTHLSWNYATLQGQPIVSNQPIDNSPANYAPLTDQLTLLNLMWQHDGWHIRPLLGPDLHAPTIVDSGDVGQPAGANIQLADDPACVAAQDVFAQLSSYSASLFNDTQQIHYLSTANPAAGCVVVLSPTLNYVGSYSSATPIAWQGAIFLERFGLTLAVNAAAHHLQPGFPLADSSEKTLAGQVGTIVGWQSSLSPSRGGDNR